MSNPEVSNYLEDIRDELQGLDQNTDEVEAKLDSVISELQDIEIDIESVDVNTDEVETKLDSVISELQDIETDVESVDANTDTVESELQDINTELDQIDANTDEVEVKLDSVISELQDIEADTEANTSELQDINTTLDSIDALVDALENALNSVGTDELRTNLVEVGGQAQSAVDVANQIDLIQNNLASVTDNISPAGDHIKDRNYGVKPDGELVGEKADGLLFEEQGALAAGEVFESDWYRTDGFRAIEVFINSNEPSVIGGLEIEYSNNPDDPTPTIEGTEERRFNAADGDIGWRAYDIDTRLDGFRLRYTNGDTATDSDFAIFATLRDDQSLEAPDYVTETIRGDQIVRIGNEPGGEGIKIGNPSSLFGDIEVIERRSVIDISSSFGTSILRDEIFTTGSGAVTEDPAATGEIHLETGTTASSTIDVRTAEYGRYVPGFSAQAGMGIRIPDPLPTTGEIRWGYYDEVNGFYFGYDGDQGELFVARLKDGSESERIYRSNWNGANIDEELGRAPGDPWTPTEGDIYQIDFSWYGYGIIVFSVITQTDDTRAPVTPTQDAIRLHALDVNQETSTSDPNEPIRIEADNEGTTDNIEVYFGGRQFSIYGNSPADERITAETRAGQTIANGAWTYIMSWQRADPNNDANSSLDVEGIDFGIDQTARLALLINPNISGTSYGTPSLTNPNETLLDVSVTGTFNGIGDGTKIWEGSLRVSGTGQAQASIDADITAQLGQNNTLVLVAQGIGGTGTAISTLRMIEDW